MENLNGNHQTIRCLGISVAHQAKRKETLFGFSENFWTLLVQIYFSSLSEA